MKVHTIDLKFQGVSGVIAAYLLESGGEAALIETGPGSSKEALLQGVADCGVEPGAVRKVFVTHAHLDHAGAAGWWAEHGAVVYCHPRARRHLVEPGKLIASARGIYGEAFDGLWGEMRAAPEERVVALQDGEEVRLGEEVIKAVETPGHARHHHAYGVGGVCFTGDVAGVRLGRGGYVSVAAAPPQFEAEPYLESVRRLRGLGFERLYLTHFGVVEEVDAYLAAYALRVEEVAEKAMRSIALGESDEQWRRRYGEEERELTLRAGCGEGEWERWQLANQTTMCADGLRLWAGERVE